MVENHMREEKSAQRIAPANRMPGLCNVICGNDHSSGTGAPSTYESYNVLVDALVDGGLSKGSIMSVEPLSLSTATLQ
jgi:hypothetical protein